jgi:hypothetical protein
MFPSPSDGPPLLSPSPSPAFGPWGMLFELEALLDEFVLDPPEEEPPEDWVD